MCLLSLGCLGFCCQRLRQACGRKDPQCLYFRLCGLPPVSHHCFWRSPLTGNERFILSGLNYIVPPDCQCFFTLNNRTWCSVCQRSEPEGNRHMEGRGRRGGVGNQDGGKNKKAVVMSKLSVLPLHFAGLEMTLVLKSSKNYCWFVCLLVCLSASRCCSFKMTVYRKVSLKFKSGFWKGSKSHLGGGKVWLILRMHPSVFLIFNLRLSSISLQFDLKIWRNHDSVHN